MAVDHQRCTALVYTPKNEGQTAGEGVSSHLDQTADPGEGTRLLHWVKQRSEGR